MRNAVTQQVREAAAARDEAVAKGRKDLETARNEASNSLAAAVAALRADHAAALASSREGHERAAASLRDSADTSLRATREQVRAQWNMGLYTALPELCAHCCYHTPSLSQWAREVEDLRKAHDARDAGLKADHATALESAVADGEARTAALRESHDVALRSAVEASDDKVLRAMERAKADIDAARAVAAQVSAQSVGLF